MLVVLLLCNVFVLEFTSDARAQCTARDVLQNQLTFKTAPPVRRLQIPVSSLADVQAWKTITIGTYSDSLALLNALSSIGCEIGGAAAEILARPTFTLSGERTVVELVAVSAAELGFHGQTASLRQIYAVAQQIGFGLASAEIGPQLRLQYLDQPIGEFLIIAMEPIKTWAGEPIVLTVANGGAGLILIGQDGHADAEISATSRLIFVRPTHALAAALARH
jgi:hypothetical protein